MVGMICMGLMKGEGRNVDEISSRVWEFGIWTWVIIAFAFFLVSRFFYAPILLSLPTNDVLVMICYNTRF